MKTIVYSFLLLFLASCASSQGTTTISYKRNNTGEHSFLDLPKGYKLQTLIGGHDEREQEYIYPDSIKVYITDLPVSMLNYNNILSLGDSISNIRFEGIELKASIAKTLGKTYTPENLTLQGKTPDGLYWKDIRRGYVSIGYVNMPPDKKERFDKVLNSFRTEK